MSIFNTELQLKDTKFAVKNKLIDSLSELKSSKFMTTLVLEFKKTQSHAKALINLYANSEAETIINQSDIADKNLYYCYIKHKTHLCGKV